MPMAYVKRVYRDTVGSGDLFGFTAKVKKTDLYVAVDRSLRPHAEHEVSLVTEVVATCVHELERYIVRRPEFLLTLAPYEASEDAPPIARVMAESASLAGVGPMAAVAGAFAEAVGFALLRRSGQVIVENGGDIFMRTSRQRRIAIFAGESMFSNRIGILVGPDDAPIAICTSSGTVGPSLSFGRADAAVAISRSAPLADAAATALGNLVRREADVPDALARAAQIPGIVGAVVIKGDTLGAWGQVELVDIATPGQSLPGQSLRRQSRKEGGAIQ